MQAEIFNRNETQQRRHAIVERIRHKSPDGQGSGLVIIPTAPEPHHGHSATRYRPDSYFLYFCGLREHTAFLVLDVRAQSHETLLFLRDKDPDMELWDGKRLGIDAAPKTLGIDAAYPLAQLETVLAERMTYHQNLYHTWNISTTLDNLLTQQMQKQRNLVRRGIQPIKAVYDFRIHADQLRVIKSDWEITQMRHTCQVSAEVMTEAMARVRAGVGEHEIMGFLVGEYYRRGLSAPSYNPIVGSHANACVLHYVDNNAVLPDQALTLIDAGGEYYGYCADITRTIPTAQRFTKAQRTIYEIVYQAQQAAIEKLREGESIDSYHQAAVRVITEGLVGLGFIDGNVDSAIETMRYKPFFMHKTGHFLGMDTHDVGAYYLGDQPQTLKAGMVLTAEPGIYIRPSAEVPIEYHHIGIRLEDDILITHNTPENLTQAAPIRAEDIEKLKKQ